MPLRHGFHRRVLSAGLLNGIAPPSRFHNGSRFRDSVPLRHGFHRGILSTGLLHGIAPPSRFHNGSRFRDSVPLRNRIPLGPLPQALSSYTLSSFHLLPPSEGVQYSPFFVSPSEGAWSRHIFESALYQRFSSRRAFPTFRRCAVFPRFRLTFRRCAEASLLRERPVSVFLQPPCVSHLPKVCSIPPFSSHLPKVCSFKMKRPDVLCRKTSIAITRILVFLPLFNRK